MKIGNLPQKLYEFQPSAEWEGKRLKEIVRLCLPEIGSRPALMLIKNGLVYTQHGRPIIDADALIDGGLPVHIDLRHGVHGRGDSKQPHLHERMQVLHDDDHVVVVSKQSGTLVQPLREDSAPTGKARTAPLIEMLKHYWRANKKEVVNPIVVQRLDLETSGLLVLGKTADAGYSLQRQLKPPRRLKREYLALVAGEFVETEGTWHTFAARGRMGIRQSLAAGKTKGSRTESMQEMVTRFKVEEVLSGATLLRLWLETGRTHQIRIHCAEAGHPVLGDDVYTKLAETTLDRMAKGKVPDDYTEHPFTETRAQVAKGVIKLQFPKSRARRLCLHATRLAFQHPGTNKKLKFESLLPDDMQRLADRLRPTSQRNP